MRRESPRHLPANIALKTVATLHPPVYLPNVRIQVMFTSVTAKGDDGGGGDGGGRGGGGGEEITGIVWFSLDSETSAKRPPG